jgi:hypothetical protein
MGTENPTVLGQCEWRTGASRARPKRMELARLEKLAQMPLATFGSDLWLLLYRRTLHVVSTVCKYLTHT